MVLQQLCTDSLTELISKRVLLSSTNVQPRFFAYEPGKLWFQLVLLERPYDQWQRCFVPLVTCHDIESHEKQYMMLSSYSELDTFEMGEVSNP